MLHLLLGEDWIANRDVILNKMARDVKGCRSGNILLVPEQISHETERRLCAVAGDKVSRYGEVLSFTRLASRVFAKVGGGARSALDPGGRMIAMAAAVEQLRAQIKVFAASSAKPEFLTQMLSAVDEFKSCCVTPADLRRVSQESEGVLAQKLEELSFLLEAYDAVCAGSGQDPRDRMTQLLEQLQNSDFAEQHQFYIDGFSDFTAQEMAILDHLLECSPEVWVSLSCREPGDKGTEFETAGQTALRLLRLAERAQVRAEIVHVPGRQDGGLQDLRQRLFSGAATFCPQIQGFGDALAFSDIWAECGYAAQEILRLCREKGARFRDFSLVCGDYPGYKPIVRAVMEQYGIPAYFSGTEEILSKSVIQTLLTAGEAAVSDLEQEPVLGYCKSVLSPLSPAECNRLENYVIIWGIQEKLWLTPWTMHPAGLSADWNEQAKAELENLNELREKVIVPLDRLRRGLAQGQNIGQQIQALAAFMEEIQLVRRIDALADSFESAGDRRTAQEMEQLWDILLDALEQMHGLLGRSVRDGEGFLRLLRLLLSQYDVGTIPAALDQITVGAVGDLRRRQAKYVFLLGAEEGKLPPYAVSGSVLTEAERETLLSLGLPLSGSLVQRMGTELAGIYGAVSAATEKVYFTTGGGQGAFLWRRVCALVNRGEELAAPDPWGSAWEAAALLAAREDRSSAEDLGLKPIYDRLRAGAGYGFGRIQPETLRQLYGQKLHLSASQIDKVAECRFGYFMRYGLRAKERKRATVDAAQFGTFVHYVLEHTAKDVESRGGFQNVSLDETMTLAQGHMEAYTAENFRDLQSRNCREDYLYKRNMEEIRAVVQELWQELRQSDFRPQGFEVHFAQGEPMPPVSLRGKDMEAEIVGFVDRVDLCQIHGVNYVRVVDYKTGKKDFDYCDILNGIGLQMLLYLYALEDGGQKLFGGKLVPAGVLYFPARMNLIAADQKQTPEKIAEDRQKDLRRKGMVLSDDDVIWAMEHAEKPVYLPCKRNKSGKLVSGVATSGQMEQLRDYIYAEVGRLIDKISEGSVEPDPYYRGPKSNACLYCEYRDACHLDAYGSQRPFRAVKEEEFWETIGGEDHG